MEHLTQKYWANKKDITIEHDSLTIKTSTISEDLEYKIKFEQLGFDIVKKRIKSANFPFFVFLFLTLLSISLIINSIVNHETFSEKSFWAGAFLFFSFMTIAGYKNRNKEVIYLTGGQHSLELHATKPDKLTVSLFIDKIHKSMRQYFKAKYTTFDPGITNEQRTNQIIWLKDIKAISDKEYLDLVDKSKTESIIGFQRPKLNE